MEEDLRYRILTHLKSLGNSTEEYTANEYLSTCHNDLGTIRRALLELINEDLIHESNYDRPNKYQKIKDIDSSVKRSGKDGPNPKRLYPQGIEYTGEKIGAIRIYITLKGLDYIRKYERFKDDDELNKVLKETSKTNADSSFKAANASDISAYAAENMANYAKETKIFTKWIAVATIGTVLIGLSNFLLECSREPKDVMNVELQSIPHTQIETVIHDTILVKNVSNDTVVVKSISDINKKQLRKEKDKK